VAGVFYFDLKAGDIKCYRLTIKIKENNDVNKRSTFETSGSSTQGLG
jgi:hypothetical protein